MRAAAVAEAEAVVVAAELEVVERKSASASRTFPNHARVPTFRPPRARAWPRRCRAPDSRAPMRSRFAPAYRNGSPKRPLAPRSLATRSQPHRSAASAVRLRYPQAPEELEWAPRPVWPVWPQRVRVRPPASQSAMPSEPGPRARSPVHLPRPSRVHVPVPPAPPPPTEQVQVQVQSATGPDPMRSASRGHRARVYSTAGRPRLWLLVRLHPARRCEVRHRLTRGSAGPAGPAGPAGLGGPAGPAGPDLHRRSSPMAPIGHAARHCSAHGSASAAPDLQQRLPPASPSP